MHIGIDDPVTRREYDHFDRYYDVGRQWAGGQVDSLLPLRFGKQRDERAYEQTVRSAFSRLGLAADLSQTKERAKYRSDAELAYRRFAAGVLDVVTETVSQRKLIMR